MAAARSGVFLAAFRAARLGLATTAVGGVAIAGGVAPGGEALTPPPVAAPVETLPPTPTPSPTPSPTPVPPPPAAIAAPEIREAEERLAAMGYWTGPVDGVLDGATRHAVMAFQKVHGRARNGRLTPDDLQAIRTAQPPTPRARGYRHVEIDIARQVLFVVETGGTVSRVLPVSSGSGKRFTAQGWTRRAVTPRGRFTVYRKIAGWRRSPLGLLHYPSYIVGGIAIHGNPSVPVYPASHGCIRVPMFASQAFSAMAPVGTVVIVHDGGPIVQEQDVASPPGADTPEAAVPASPPPSESPAASATPSPTPSAAVGLPSGSPGASPSPSP